MIPTAGMDAGEQKNVLFLPELKTVFLGCPAL
jgi:hypothetical protein